MDKDLEELRQKLIEFNYKYGFYITIENFGKRDKNGKVEIADIKFKLIQ